MWRVVANLGKKRKRARMQEGEAAKEIVWLRKNRAKVLEVADLLHAKSLDLQHLRSSLSFFFYTEVKVQKVQVQSKSPTWAH